MWPNLIKLNLFKYSYIFTRFFFAHVSNFDNKQVYKNDNRLQLKGLNLYQKSFQKIGLCLRAFDAIISKNGPRFDLNALFEVTKIVSLYSKMAFFVTSKWQYLSDLSAF